MCTGRHEMNDWQWILVGGIATLLPVVWLIWPWRQSWRVWIGLAAFLVVSAGLLYAYFGSGSSVWAYERHLDEQRHAQAVLKTYKRPEILIQRLQAHLSAQPNSARGWYLLGRLYASQHQWRASLQAFQHAYQIQPQDENTAINYAQSLLSSGERADRVQARQILKAVLQQNPQQVDALGMLAMDAQWQHRNQQALKYWQQLLGLLPSNATEADIVRKAILSIQSQQNRAGMTPFIEHSH